MNAQHTPGPWRWEFNADHKTVDLVGGRPMFDLTVMDFARWGMGHAVPRFRDTTVDGMNLMDRLCDKPEWIAPEPGREHHKRWHQLVTHPDARLIAASPTLLAALEFILEMTGEPPEKNCSCHISPPCNDCVEHSGWRDAFEFANTAIAKATGGGV